MCSIFIQGLRIAEMTPTAANVIRVVVITKTRCVIMAGDTRFLFSISDTAIAFISLIATCKSCKKNKYIEVFVKHVLQRLK